MPHSINIDTIHENIFILMNIAYAFDVFQKKHDFQASDTEDIIDSDYYSGWFRAILSEKLVESAIKTRLLMDLVLEEEKEYSGKFPTDLLKKDQDICTHISIGEFKEGEGKISIRVACNKIIHATDWQPALDSQDNIQLGNSIWSGHILFFGRKGKSEWIFSLNLVKFSLALEELLCYLENDVDWHHLYKYDNIFF